MTLLQAQPRAQQSPGVCIIIPFYKQAKYLPEAIQSVRAQTRPVDQIIVVDDGSPEDLTPYQAVLSQVTLIRQPNRGASAARNAGILATTCEYVLFLDADDTLAPDAIEHLLAAFEKDPQLNVVFGGWEDVDVEHQLIRRNPPPALTEPAYLLFLPNNQIPIHCFLVRKQAIGLSGLFDTVLQWHEDMDFWVRLALSSGCFGRIESCVARYRRHPGTMSSQRPEMYEGWHRVLHKITLRFPHRKELAAAVARGHKKADMGYLREIVFGSFFDRPSLVTLIIALGKLLRVSVRKPWMLHYTVISLFRMMNRSASTR